MNLRRTLSVAGLLLVASMSVAAADSWLHVRVDSDKGEKVRVNLPLALVSTVLPILGDKKVANAKLRMHGIELDNSELTVRDLREIWRAVKASGSYELANIESEDTKLHVFVDKDYLRVKADENSKEKIQVKVPVAVVDALLSGTGDELDLMAGIQALQQLGEEQLVEVEAEDTRVKIWIDNSSGS